VASDAPRRPSKPDTTVLREELRALQRELAHLRERLAGAELRSAHLGADARFRKLLENLPRIAVQGYGPDGTVHFWNQANETVYGYTAEEAMGRDLVELIIPPEMRDMVRACTDRAAAGEEMPPAGEFDLLRKDGSRVPVFSSHAVLRAPGREPELFCIDVDLTEVRRAQAALRESEKKYRTLVETSPDAIFMLDREARVLFANQRALGYLDRPVEQVTGRLLRELLDENRARQALFLIRRVFAERRSFQEEGTTQDRDGARRDLSIILAPVPGEDGEVEAVMGLARDITERKRAEEKLLRFQKELRSLASEAALAEERERHRIAAEFHEEIGQTLAVAKVRLGGILQEAPAGLRPSLEEVRGLMEQTIQDLRVAIFQLSPPILYEVGFESAVEWLLEQLQAHHDVETAFEDDGRDKPLAEDVRVALFQAVREALANVAKHARARRVRVTLRREGDALCTVVRDDGVGFDPAGLEQAHRDLRGYGLFSIRERLLHLGGAMELDTAPGAGTTLALRVPLQEPGAGESKA